MKTFRCRFKGGAICTIAVSDKQPPPGQAHIQKVEWSGTKPTRKVFRPYIEWMNSINQQLADEWGATIMHVFLLTPTTPETWTYEPGQKPMRVP